MKDAYSPYIHSRLDKARKNKVSVIRGLLPNEFINFLRNRSVMASGRLNRDTINKLRRIIAFAINHNLGEIYAAYSSKNELCAAVLFLKSNRKVHLLFSGISKDGIHEGAMALLIDRFIEKNTEKNLTLNFENLVIPGKEEFFTGFGASKYHYKTIKNPRNFLFNPVTGGHNHSFF
jgi:hypothetical protein